MSTFAVFYILSGQEYIDEARLSAASVKQHMPNVRRILLTPDEIARNGIDFTGVYSLHNRADHWYADSIRYLAYALSFLPEYLVWLDSDTYCCMPFDEIFDLLGRFDLVGVHSPGRITGKAMDGIPACFPELNIGVLGLHNTTALRAFVTRWYCQHLKGTGISDQISLRETLWSQPAPGRGEECFRFYVMPPEWNLRLVSTDGYFIRDKVRFLHGRPMDTMPALAESVNRMGGMRVWRP
jgi:hypothetical protein